MSCTPPSSPAPVVTLVNDDPVQLSFLARILERGGLNVQSHLSAEAALGAMDPDNPPGIVVTDLYMPGIDGWRLCRLIRSAEFAPFNAVPVLVVSSTYAGEEPDRIAADLGAEAFLSAPVDPRLLLERVQAILEGRRMRSQPRVLIVEDSRTLAGILRKAFNENGYQADVTAGVAEATAAFQAVAYDVAVLDYHLPDGLGDTLLDTFRTERPTCVCLMMTTDPGPSLALDWMKRGAADYLRKPFQVDFLLELCARARRERALLRVQDMLEQRTRELRESEEKFRLIAENTSDGLLVLGPGLGVEYISPSYLLQMGLSAAEGLPGGLLASIHPEDRGTVAQRVDAAIERRDPELKFTYRVRHREGHDIWREDHARFVFGPQGEHRRTYVVCRDITGKLRAEEEVRRQADFARRILDSTDAHLAVVQGDGLILDVNEAWRLFGRANGAGDESAWGPGANYFRNARNGFESVYEGIRQVQAGRLPFYEMEYPCHSPGEERWFSMRVLPFQGWPGTVLVAHIDITILKRAEARLQESEARMRALLNAVPDLMFTLDAEGTFVDGHAPEGSPLYMPPEEFLGRNVRDIFPAEAAETTLAHMDEIRRTGATGTYCYESWLEGEKRYFECRMVPCTREQVLAMVRDISDRRRAEEEGAALQAQLIQAQKMESVGRLAGGVAHDFNNMLCVILGLGDLLLSRTDPGHPSHGHLTEIQKAAERSADLTRQLLAFARRQTIAPRVLDLNTTVDDMFRMLQRLIGEDINLRWTPGQDLWHIKMDPTQVDQILANLCVNSRDAITDVGTITISTANREVAEADCLSRPGLAPGDYVLLAVADDGHGMSEETRKKIFEPFFTTKEVGKGTGLGLATVYGIVKQNHGWIQVESQPGAGTRMTVFLPRDQSPPEEPRPESPLPQPGEDRETILLVEDEPAILAMTTGMLQQLGYVVLPGSSPAEALRLAESPARRIDLILADVVLPRMNGRDLARSLRVIHPEARILFMSGYAADVAPDAVIREDGIPFLQKPFSLKELEQKVREALSTAP